MKKLTLFSLVALFSVAVIAAPQVRAEDGTDSIPAKVSAESEKSSVFKDGIKTSDAADAKGAFSGVEDRRDKTLDHCTVVQAKIKGRLLSDGQASSNHEDHYTKLQNALTNLIARANNAGYDTTDLTADLAVLKAKVTTFETDATVYTKSLQTSQTDVCAKSEGEFKDAILSSRSDLAALFADAKDIQTYVTSTIEPAVKVLKKSSGAIITPTATNAPAVQK